MYVFSSDIMTSSNRMAVVFSHGVPFNTGKPKAVGYAMDTVLCIVFNERIWHI
jgi:hypothetical protein